MWFMPSSVAWRRARAFFTPLIRIRTYKGKHKVFQNRKQKNLSSTLTLSLQAKDKTLPRIQNTSQNLKHIPESKTLPKIQNTSQNPKTLPQNPKHVPESKTRHTTPKHFRIIGHDLDSGSVLSLWTMVCSGSFFIPPPEPPGELACRLVKLTLSSRRNMIVMPAPWDKEPQIFPSIPPQFSSKFNHQTQLKHVFPYMYNNTELKKQLEYSSLPFPQQACPMGKSTLKVICPTRKSTYTGLSDRNSFQAMNFRRIHKVSVLSKPKKATPHILSQSKLSAPYLLSIHHRGHTHRKSHGGDLADVIIKKACISYNGVFCQGLHPCPWFQWRSRLVECNMTIITNSCKNYRVVAALKSLPEF